MLLLLKHRISSLRTAKLFCRFKCDVIFFFVWKDSKAFICKSKYLQWQTLLYTVLEFDVRGQRWNKDHRLPATRFQLLNSLFIVWPGNIGGTMIGSLIDNVWQVTFVQLWVCPRVLMLQKCSLAPRKSYVVFGLTIYKCCF